MSTEQTFKIRPAREEDLSSVQNCAREAYAKYVPRIGRDPAPMIADFATQITDHVLYVGDDDGAVMGFVVFYPRDDHMHLENVAVCNNARGKGLGAGLISFVENEARRLEIPTVELYTNEKMTENIPYYLKRGYVEIERREEDGFNRIFFRKLL